MDPLVLATNINCSPLSSCVKYLKSLSDKFLTNESRLEFINDMLSIKTKFLLIAKAMHYSYPFSIKLIFTSNVPLYFYISFIIEGLS